MATVAITGGGFSDSEGNPLEDGIVYFSLSADAVDSETGTQQICSGQRVSFDLDDSGNVPSDSFLWPNDLLIGNVSGLADTFYWVSAEDENGQLVYGPNAFLILSTAADLSDLIPGNPS
jgi:hypothetical protein